MNKEFGWYHPVDESDQWDGFNDSGIETFAGSPIEHLAREVNQNSLDAAESQSNIVDIRIRLHDVQTNEIPDLEELQTNLELCYEASKKESNKAKVFFEIALSELGKSRISVLEVSDFNTFGMKGPSKNGTPFYAFMKAKGQSRKESSTAAGSYGIGKFAPYAVSKIRTIFVSSVYKNSSGSFRQLTQGKSILMSHDINGTRKLGVGFWGKKEKCQPIVGISSGVPDWIQRVNRESDLPEMKGTKLSILCFATSKDWREYLAVSVAENFFAAICNNNLRVDIDGYYILDKDSIHDFFNRDDIRSLIEGRKNEPKQFDNRKYYLAALQEEDIIVEESQNTQLGLCQIRILVREGLPKKVCALRNGMFISDYLNGLKSFSDFKDFVAVFTCLSSKGNELLRNMEPPKHDDFEPDRLLTPEEQALGTLALKSLARWIRQMLRRHAKDPVSEVTEIDELKEYFSDEGAEGTGDSTEEINPFGEVKIQAKPIKIMSLATKKPGEGAQGGEGDGTEGGDGGQGQGGGDGEGGKGGGNGGTGSGSRKSAVDIKDFRAVPLDAKTRKVSFTPTISGTISLRLMEAGADSDYETSIMKTSRGELDKGGAILDVTAESRFTLEIEMRQDFLGALKVVAHEV